MYLAVSLFCITFNSGNRARQRTKNIPFIKKPFLMVLEYNTDESQHGP